MRRRIECLLLMLFALLAASARGSVYIHPNFGEPIVFEDVILFTSPDSKRIVAIDHDGNRRWERSYGKDAFLQRLDASTAVVQVGRTVYRIDPTDGRAARMRRLPRHEVLVVDDRHNFVLGFDDRFDVRHARFRDRETLEVLWETSDIEDVAGANDELLLIKTGVRDYEKLVWSNVSYQLRDVVMRALDRRDGTTRWEVPLGDRERGAQIEFVGHHAVLSTGFMPGELLVIDSRDGTVLGRREFEHFVSSMIALGGKLAYLANGASDEDAYRIATLPDLTDVSSVTIRSRESLTILQASPWLVTRGIYSAAAFDPATGTRLWEKEQQMRFATPSNDRIVASVAFPDKKTASVMLIDVPSGEERVLLTEPAEDAATPHESLCDRFESLVARIESGFANKAKRSREKRRLPPVGAELCFQAANTGVGALEDDLILERDGTYTHVTADDGVVRSRDQGVWTRDGDTWALRAEATVRDVSTDRLSVLVGHRDRVPLLIDLEIAIESLLAGPLETFDEATLERASVRVPGCPPHLSGYCTVDGHQHMGASITYSPETFDGVRFRPASREDLEELRIEIRRYLASEDKNLFRFELHTWRSYRFPVWQDGRLLWNENVDYARDSIDQAEDFGAPVRVQVMAPCGDVRVRTTRLVGLDR